MQLLFKYPCEKITRFDIRIIDPYCHGDTFTTIEGSENLALQEVWEWLCQGGDWKFEVTAHGDPTKVFLSGYTYHDHCLRAAVDGHNLAVLCTATDDEAYALKKQVYKRVKKEMGLLDKDE
jgi:hypothetical protein